MIEYNVIITLFALIVAINFIRANNIIDVVLLNCIFSVLTVLAYLNLDAPDVAMTEAMVGGVSSVFAILSIKSLYKQSYSFNESFKPFLFFPLIVIAMLLIYASYDLPEFGKANFDPYYLANTKRDIGIPSAVTAILADYRGYDTFLETLVIFIAGLAIYLISPMQLKITSYIRQAESCSVMDAKILQLPKTILKLILPFILLFAFYIQMHGEVSPGGGFQAGAILGSGLILYALIFENSALLKIIDIRKIIKLAILGILIYFSTGLMGIIGGSNFLNYNIFFQDIQLAHQIGIIIVELGVGLCVSATMLLIYFCLGINNESAN